MKLRTISYLLIIAMLSSCVAGKKREALVTQIKENQRNNRMALRQIEKIDSVRNEKASKNELDEKSNRFIEHYTDSVKKVLIRHMQDDSILLSKRIKHKRLDSLTVRVQQIKTELQGNLGNLQLLDELLATNTFTQLNTASVFGPGEFLIDLQTNPAAADPFKKVVDDMLAFAAKFPTKKLNGTFVVVGYADAQQISPGTALDSTLRASMGVESASSPQLNKELSRLRAKSVTEVITGIFTSKTNGVEIYRNLSADYLPQGRGEEYPNPKIRDYREEDERRRVVYVYWSILPELN
jgi:outer membrane protein OmpA-like peptidoglycan-associated protein